MEDANQKEFIQWLTEKLQAVDDTDLQNKLKNLGEEGIKKAYDMFMKQGDSSMLMAKNGAKLEYIKCLQEFKKGGKMASCNCGGGKMKKKMKYQTGGIMTASTMVMPRPAIKKPIPTPIAVKKPVINSAPVAKVPNWDLSYGKKNNPLIETINEDLFVAPMNSDPNVMLTTKKGTVLTKQMWDENQKSKMPYNSPKEYMTIVNPYTNPDEKDVRAIAARAFQQSPNAVANNYQTTQGVSRGLNGSYNTYKITPEQNRATDSIQFVNKYRLDNKIVTNEDNARMQMQKAGLKFKDGGSLKMNIDNMTKLGFIDQTVSCNSCNWTWKLSEGGDDPYTCHNCNTSVKSKMKKGGLIKRADGSSSKKGLWDNIRANKGSGKEPTKQMLAQEKKIKAK